MVTTKAPEQCLSDALSELVIARRDYDEAHAKAEAARRIESEARGRLSRAQKQVDADVAALRKDAPWDSEWSRRTERVPA